MKKEDPQTLMDMAMEAMWQYNKPDIHTNLTMKEVWEKGFEAGYLAGIDRGMEIEHDLNEDLKLEL